MTGTAAAFAGLADIVAATTVVGVVGDATTTATKLAGVAQRTAAKAHSALADLAGGARTVTPAAVVVIGGDVGAAAAAAALSEVAAERSAVA